MHNALVHIRRTPYQSLSMFLMQFFVVFLILVILAGAMFVLSVLASVESEPRVVVYFQASTPETEIFKVRDYLFNSGKTTRIDYIDKNMAFDAYKKLAGDSQLLAEVATPDILPASLEIKAKSAAYLEEIASYLRGQKGIDEVQYQKSTVTKLLQITALVRIIVLGFVGFLTAITLVILSTMITFKIALRRDEIEIYQLLGAKSGFIRKPFFVESTILTTLATVVGIFVFFGVLELAHGSLATYLDGVAQLAVTYGRYTLTVWPKNFIFLGVLSGVVWLYMLLISSCATYFSTIKFVR